MPLKLITREDGKVVGTLKDGIFRKRVSLSKHLMRKHDAWGMDVEILERLPEDCQIRVLDEESGRVYAVTKADWEANDIVEDAGHGMQSFLSRSYFAVVEPLNQKT